MQIALIGTGAVAGIHAARLGGAGARLAAVCGSKAEKAAAFARAYGIERVATDLDAALEGVDAAVIASPSGLHFEQARRAVERGISVLVELPPCESATQARELERLAGESGRVLQCCHTSRYLEPYRLIRDWIHDGTLGEIRQLHYLRGMIPRDRSWTDDALRHHAAHPIDLLLDWFAAVEPVAGVGLPTAAPYTEVNLLARLPTGAPVTMAISYSGRKPMSQATLFGSRHTVATDGFSWIDSDDPALVWRADRDAVYHQAIGEQDTAFLDACRTGRGGVPWTETMQMIEVIDAFQRLCKT